MKLKASIEEINEYFSYDSLTGEVKWIKQRGKVYPGDIVGWITTDGGIQTTFKRVRYELTHIIWVLYYKRWPILEIDHIDRNRLNNQIINLREVSTQNNSKNSKKYITNTTGVTGVYWNKYFKKWEVKIRNYGSKQIGLGYYKNFYEAIYTRWIAENIYQYHSTHGR